MRRDRAQERGTVNPVLGYSPPVSLLVDTVITLFLTVFTPFGRKEQKWLPGPYTLSGRDGNNSPERENNGE